MNRTAIKSITAMGDTGWNYLGRVIEKDGVQIEATDGHAVGRDGEQVYLRIDGVLVYHGYCRPLYRFWRRAHGNAICDGLWARRSEPRP